MSPSLTGYSSDDALMDESLFDTDPSPNDTQSKLENKLNTKNLPPHHENKIIEELDKITNLLGKK